MKYLLALFFLNISLLSILDADMISIHKRIIPISLLQISDIIKKEKREINFIIATKENQIAKALEFKELLPKTVKSFVLKSVVVTDNNIKEYLIEHKNSIDAIYCFDLTKSSCKLIKEFTTKNKVPTFSYSVRGFKRGALLYIEIKNKIHIYMNRKTMKNVKINFNNQFLQMVEMYDK
jgi:hypothetical protein